MGGHGEKDLKKRVKEKVVSAAHQEYNNRHTLSRVSDQIRSGGDLFGRDAVFVRREIDETYPEYIRTHQNELDFLIMKEEKPLEKAVRKTRMFLRDTTQAALLPVKRLARKILRHG